MSTPDQFALEYDSAAGAMPVVESAAVHRQPRRTITERRPIAPLELPNVFVVGAIKSGTTALYHYFKQHPQIFVPQSIKETNFMAFYEGMPPLAGPGDAAAWTGTSITTLTDYQNLYALRTEQPLAADVSPSYLYYPQAARKIAELCPHAKIVMVLRNPIDCAFSMYSMMRRDGREPCRNFREAFRRSAERIAAGWEWAWDYQRCPLYAAQVSRFQRLFPASQLFIRRYADLKHDPQQFYEDLNAFLGIPPINLAVANQQVNVSPTRREMLRRRKWGRWLLRGARAATILCPASIKNPLRKRFVDRPAFVLGDKDRQMLIDHFAPSVLELGDMLSLDLSEWLKA